MITPPKRRWYKVQSLDDQGSIPLTPEAHERMKARLARVRSQLPALAAEAGEAAALGDRSDNAAYKEAKSLLRRAQRQALMLEDQLKRVVEIGSGPGGSGVVQLGTTVALQPLGGEDGRVAAEKRAVTFRIVGPFETNPARGLISHKSPLGDALIGHSKGDTVSVPTSRGIQRYRILAVE